MRTRLLSKTAKSRRMSSLNFCRLNASSSSSFWVDCSSPSGGGEGSCLGRTRRRVSLLRMFLVVRKKARSSICR